jgi:aldose 1-epimerase
MTTVTQKPFGSMPNPTTGSQQSVAKFIVKNLSGAELHLITYGAAVTNLFVPDKLGKLEDVVLGFDDLEGIYTLHLYYIVIIKFYML